MKVICQATDGKALGDTFYKSGYSPHTKFPLVEGEVYTVYAQCLSKGGILYLIAYPNINGPDWYPADLFTISEHKLPDMWIFTYDSECAEYGVPAIWGYPELIEDPDHFDGIAERIARHVDIFDMRKAEIDAIEPM